MKKNFKTNSSQAQVFNTNLRRHHFSNPSVVPPPLHRLGQRGPILPSRSIIAHLGFGLSILFRANQAQLLTTRALKHVKKYATIYAHCAICSSAYGFDNRSHFNPPYSLSLKHFIWQFGVVVKAPNLMKVKIWISSNLRVKKGRICFKRTLFLCRSTPFENVLLIWAFLPVLRNASKLFHILMHPVSAVHLSLTHRGDYTRV